MAKFTLLGRKLLSMPFRIYDRFCVHSAFYIWRVHSGTSKANGEPDVSVSVADWRALTGGVFVRYSSFG